MKSRLKILVIDVGGTHIKVMVSGARAPRRFASGPRMTAAGMILGVGRIAADWRWDAVSIGYPAPVVHGRPVREPYNLGGGWVGFDFVGALGAPVKMINDAAMQALGSYRGGRMLFLGLGTGLGSAMVADGAVEPMEIAHLPYHKRTYEDYTGQRGLERLGHKKWQKHVYAMACDLRNALQAEYVVFGGGNARLLRRLPAYAMLGSNANAFVGGRRLWDPRFATPVRPLMGVAPADFGRDSDRLRPGFGGQAGDRISQRRKAPQRGGRVRQR